MSGEYYKTRESVEEYIKLAEGINGNQLIEELKQVLPVNSNLLEIGSGPGTDWKILRETYNVVGSDNSKQFINYLSVNNPDGDFIVLDAKTIKVDKKFDGVYSNKVLIHLNDGELINSFKRQYEILNPQGIVCHSFWKGEGSEIFKGLLVNYQTEGSLKDICGDYFEILSISSYKEFEDEDSLLLIGRKK